MSRAIAAARPSIKSAVAAGRQPTPQSTKQTRPMADCRSASIKALPRRRPAAIIPPLRRLVSPRLTRRSHPDCRAIAYALRSVSILQTWTYKPQKRQDVSDFALTYSLRLRSCKSLDAFIISSLPSRLKETLQTAGSLAPWALLHFLATNTHTFSKRTQKLSQKIAQSLTQSTI